MRTYIIQHDAAGETTFYSIAATSTLDAFERRHEILPKGGRTWFPREAANPGAFEVLTRPSRRARA